MGMSLMINAPVVEGKLRNEAAKRGVSVEHYAETILASHLAPDAAFQVAAPFYETATLEEWTNEFDAWVDSHPVRQSLPDYAFSRESFYEGR
jgi:hypothetical protein